MTQIWDNLETYINIPYLIVFMMLSYTFKGSIKVWLSKLFKSNIRKTAGVFLIGVATGAIFKFMFKHDLMIIFVTFSVGTCLHEFLFRIIEEKFFPKKAKPLADLTPDRRV